MADDDDIPPLEDIPDVKTEVVVVKPIVKQVEQSPKEKSFAGMKKGFLNSGGNSIAKPVSNELIEIRRKKPEETKDFRVFDEVQQAIKEEEKSKNNWLTNDLLKQIEDDESLAQYFSNPYFMEAITLFQHKPQEAMTKYGHNAEVMKFFNKMAKILGNHFTSIADNEEKQKQTKVDPDVNRILQDEETRKLLLDPAVVQLLNTLREQPEKAQWIMRTADTTMRDKIRRLVELGLLNIV